MGYEDYCDLFGPPAPLFKCFLPHVGRNKIPQMRCLSSISSHCPNPIPNPNQSCCSMTSPRARRWRRSPKSMAAKTLPRTYSAPPSWIFSAPASSRESCPSSARIHRRPSESVWECARKATTRNTSSSTFYSAAMRGTCTLMQWPQKTKIGWVKPLR